MARYILCRITRSKMLYDAAELYIYIPFISSADAFIHLKRDRPEHIAARFSKKWYSSTQGIWTHNVFITSQNQNHWVLGFYGLKIKRERQEVWPVDCAGMRELFSISARGSDSSTRACRSFFYFLYIYCHLKTLKSLASLSFRLLIS